MYRAKKIRLVDLRVWFACKEMSTRRSFRKKADCVRYGLDELHRLVGGVGGEHLRASLRRLEAAQLLWWSEHDIRFGELAGESGNELLCTANELVHEMAGKIATGRRLVPVPRRQLRLLASGARRAVIATVLAHLIRCLFIKRGQVNARGFCKASWIASVFGVGERNIKDARSHLERIGLLVPIATPQWRMNRLGKCLAVNLGWSRTEGERSLRQTRSAPPRRHFTTRSAPPESNKELLTDLKNQNPARCGRSGVWERTRPEPKPPALSNIVPQDLQSTGRLLGLFRQAVQAGLVVASENARIQFLAAAEHARAIGTQNPCGLFAAIVRRKLWQVITQDDEDVASAKLKAFLDRKGMRGCTHGAENAPTSVRAILESFGTLSPGEMRAC